MNSLFSLTAYKDQTVWMFDDEERGILREPFVAGIDTMMDIIASGAPYLRIIFAASPFPTTNLVLEKLHAEYGGTWYRCSKLGIDGWLCPVLFEYFTIAPDVLYIDIQPQKEIENEENN